MIKLSILLQLLIRNDNFDLNIIKFIFQISEYCFSYHFNVHRIKKKKFYKLFSIISVIQNHSGN